MKTKQTDQKVRRVDNTRSYSAKQRAKARRSQQKEANILHGGKR